MAARSCPYCGTKEVVQVEVGTGRCECYGCGYTWIPGGPLGVGVYSTKTVSEKPAV